MLIVFVFVAAIAFSVILSRHQNEIQRLSEELALLAARRSGEAEGRGENDADQ